MKSGKMNAIILVDFGMTASAAECFITSAWDDLLPFIRYKFGKTPTKLIYGINGEVIAWGAECNNNNNNMHAFQGEFKADFAESGNTPTKLYGTDKLISDYLDHFGRSIINSVVQSEKTTCESLKARWYLTTPGCWLDSKRADFQLLANRVFTNILPGSEVFADINESLASCEYLVKHLPLAVNTWAITCDIGGATCDSALAVIRSEHTKAAPFIQSISGTGAHQGSVGYINSKLEEFLKLFFRNAEVAISAIPIKILVESAEWELARHGFDGSTEVRFTVEEDFGKWKSPAGIGSIDGRMITLSRGVMEHLFKGFLENVFAEIDKAIEKLAANTTRGMRPSVIALSGGGGTMKYLLNQLKARYGGDIEIKAPASTEESRLATISGHALYRMRVMRDDFLQEIFLGISDHCSAAKSSAKIKWLEDPLQSQEFAFSSRKEIVRHYVIVQSRSSPRPKPKSMGDMGEIGGVPGAWKGTLVWVVDIAGLGQNPILGQKYCIEVICSGRSEFSFKAYEKKKPNVILGLVSERYHRDA